MDLFELLEKEKEVSQDNNLPLFTEMAIDFNTGEIIEENGEIKKLTGKEALNVWVWKALKTERNRYKAYSSSFGNDLTKEIGYVYDRTVKEQLIINEIMECLLVNPYITNVYNFELNYDEENVRLDVKFYIDSIYGTATQEVEQIAI